MIRWYNIVIPLSAAAAAAALIDIPTWDQMKSGLLVALSVMAAGVLVRLARGLPFTSADHYEVDEVRRLTKAVEQIMRSLKLLILAVLLAMIVLVTAASVSEAFNRHLPAVCRWTDPTLSSLIGLLLAYVCVRMWQVIRGDQELTHLQSKFIVRAVERKQAKRFEDQIGPSEGSFKTPSGYGKIVN